VTFWIAPDYEDVLTWHSMADMLSFIADHHGLRLDKAGLAGWRQRWRIRFDGPAGRQSGWTCYLKRFTSPPFSAQWGRWLEGRPFDSTAGIEWGNARELAKAGIDAVIPIAFGQVMVGPWEKRSFILLAEVQGESLEQWVPWHLAPSRRERRWEIRHRRLDQLAELVARLHKAGFVHRDLYLCHIFITTDGGQDRLTLIDLQRVFRPRWRRRRWIIKDLAALNFSTPVDRVGRFERLRFLCRYLRYRGEIGSVRSLVRWIDAKTRRMAKRKVPPVAGGWPMESEGANTLR